MIWYQLNIFLAANIYFLSLHLEALLVQFLPAQVYFYSFFHPFTKSEQSFYAYLLSSVSSFPKAYNNK